MIIRETRVQECWCPVCGSGQMADIHVSFLVSAKSDFSKSKSNDDINKWLNNNEPQKAS